mgnify:CR=1 FL=1
MLFRSVSGAWSDAVLKDYMQRAELDVRDAALCTTLCYGVLQNLALLDYHIDSFLKGRKRIQPVLRDILRLAVYQLLFLDRVPDSAAVNEAVKQAKKQFGQREANLVNALLRNLLREKDTLTLPKDYSIRYSHPASLVDLMKASAGKRLGAILEADNSSPETCAQWNPLRGDEHTLLEAWMEEGVRVTPHPWMAHGYLLRGTGSLQALPSFQKGLFQVQDAAARLSVQVLELAGGMRVLDLCAAPGGKSLAAAMYMENEGRIIACDIHSGKLGEITASAERLGISIIETMENDASIFHSAWAGGFDVVIADVPCSGLGVIRKKPDIRYRDPRALEALPPLQGHILETAAEYVRPGGQMLYSTCTILKQENEEVVQGFLSGNPEFQPERLSLPEPLKEQQPGMLTLYQGIDGCDGFFLCRMRRKNRPGTAGRTE